MRLAFTRLRERRTVIVKSAHPVPISPPFPIPASLRSARNSGKLRRHTPRRACRPSLSSFSLRSALRVIRSSHLSWNMDNAEYEASAWKVYLCSPKVHLFPPPCERICGLTSTVAQELCQWPGTHIYLSRRKTLVLQQLRA